MENNNDIPDIDHREHIDYCQLSYGENIEVGDLVITATDKFSTKEEQYICNEAPAIKKTPKP